MKQDAKLSNKYWISTWRNLWTNPYVFKKLKNKNWRIKFQVHLHVKWPATNSSSNSWKMLKIISERSSTPNKARLRPPPQTLGEVHWKSKFVSIFRQLLSEHLKENRIEKKCRQFSRFLFFARNIFLFPFLVNSLNSTLFFSSSTCVEFLILFHCYTR